MKLSSYFFWGVNVGAGLESQLAVENNTYRPKMGLQKTRGDGLYKTGFIDMRSLLFIGFHGLPRGVESTPVVCSFPTQLNPFLLKTENEAKRVAHPEDKSLCV